MARYYLAIYNIDMNIFVIILSSLLGGFVQTVAGFGSGIVIMLFLPYIMPIMKASALNNIVTMTLNIMLIYKFRKHINFKSVLLPAIISFAFSTIAIYIGTSLDLNTMKMIFSIFMIVLALYFMFFSDKISLKNTLPTVITCSSLAGIANGLFGIGGPPMALYFLTTTSSKEEYIGTTQIFFFMTSVYTTLVRVISGVITMDLLTLFVPGVIAIIIGEYIGIKVIDKISHKRMKQLMYYVLAISGVLTFVQCL